MFSVGHSQVINQMRCYPALRRLALTIRRSIKARYLLKKVKTCSSTLPFYLLIRSSCPMKRSFSGPSKISEGSSVKIFPHTVGF